MRRDPKTRRVYKSLDIYKLESPFLWEILSQHEQDRTMLKKSRNPDPRAGEKFSLDRVRVVSFIDALIFS